MFGLNIVVHDKDSISYLLFVNFKSELGDLLKSWRNNKIKFSIIVKIVPINGMLDILWILTGRAVIWTKPCIYKLQKFPEVFCLKTLVLMNCQGWIGILCFFPNSLATISNPVLHYWAPHPFEISNSLPSIRFWALAYNHYLLLVWLAKFLFLSLLNLILLKSV